MKPLLKIKNIFIGGMVILAIGLSYALFTDEYSQAKFRTMQDNISSHEKVDLSGLRELHASGGPIVNFPELKKKLHHVTQKIIVADAIRQYHGYMDFALFKEVPTTFFAYERGDPDIRHLLRRLIFTGTTQIRSERVSPEKKLAEKYGFDYKNIKVDSRVLTPDASVDAFVAYFDTLPENVWVHFHCRLGKGRTSIMLVMLDIMKNAPNVALEDIVKRQHLLGSENLFNTVARHGGSYFSSTLKRRKKFIEDFYAFICQRKADGIQEWSQWRQTQQKEPL